MRAGFSGGRGFMQMRLLARVAVPVWVALIALICALPLSGAPKTPNAKEVPAGLKAYQSPYYDVYSDLEPQRVQEAILRMTRMAEEYHERTKEFSGAIRTKFPFYLFEKGEDYYAAGGM